MMGCNAHNLGNLFQMSMHCCCGFRRKVPPHLPSIVAQAQLLAVEPGRIKTTGMQENMLTNACVVQIIDGSQRGFDRDCGVRRVQVQRTNFMFSERCERPVQRLPDPLLRRITVLAGIHSVRNVQDKSKDCGRVGKLTLCRRRSFRCSSDPKTARYELTNGLALSQPTSSDVPPP